jgi:diguanylate cyclase (GGDEF)-like protein
MARSVKSIIVESEKQIEGQNASAILKSVLFTDLMPGETNAIVNRTEILTIRKNGLLFSPGEKAEHLYLLIRGTIRVFKQNESGRNDEIAHFAPGDIIGDFDFARGADYDAYAEAEEDSSLLMFPGFGRSMEKFALEEPHIMSRVLLNSAAMVTERIKSTRKVIIEKAYWVQGLHRRIHEDPTTGLWKQTFLTEEINQILERPMALVMLKPDRFKVLVDSRGHDAGDDAMIKIAAILKGITHKLDRGWAIRFRSNETGILINKCDSAQAKSLALSLSEAVAAIPPVPLDKEQFSFSGSIAWGTWPVDDKSWDSLLTGTYQLLMDTWKDGGNKIVHYRKGKKS